MVNDNELDFFVGKEVRIYQKVNDKIFFFSGVFEKITELGFIKLKDDHRGDMMIKLDSISSLELSKVRK